MRCRNTVFSIFDTDQLGKIGRHHNRKSAFKLVTLLNISAVSDTYFVYVLREPRYICENCAPKPFPPTSVTIPTKRLKNFATSRSSISVSFQQITFKLSNCNNFKTLFQMASTDFFPPTYTCQKLKKNMERSVDFRGLFDAVLPQETCCV